MLFSVIIIGLLLLSEINKCKDDDDCQWTGILTNKFAEKVAIIGPIVIGAQTWEQVKENQCKKM